MTTSQELEEFTNHELWQRISETTADINATRPRDTIDRQTRARALSVLGYLSEYKSMPTSLFRSDRSVTASILVASVETIRSQFAGWDQAAAMVQPTVNQIDISCDEILATVSSSAWPSLQKESRARAIRESADTFRIAAESSLEALEGQVAAAQTALRTVETQLSAITAQAALREQEAADAQVRLESTIAEATVEAKRNSDLAISEINEKAVLQRTQATADSERLLKQLRLDSANGEKLVAMVGDQAVGGGYAQFARREMTAYWFLNGFGLLVAVVTFVLLQDAVKEFKEADPLLSVLKATISLTGIGLATYAFREAGKRHRQSVAARYRALDLLALRPFTTEMEESQRDSLRYILGERLFAAAPVTNDQTNKNDKTTTFKVDLDSLKTLAETVKATKDAIG